MIVVCLNVVEDEILDVRGKVRMDSLSRHRSAILQTI